MVQGTNYHDNSHHNKTTNQCTFVHVQTRWEYGYTFGQYTNVLLCLPSKQEIRIKRTTTGKWAGCLFIDCGKFDGPSYGKIDQTGALTIYRDGESIKSDLVALLTEFANDPAAVAARCGKLLTRCSFCRRKLTDDRSTTVGYGPDCADHFGLPWG